MPNPMPRPRPPVEVAHHLVRMDYPRIPGREDPLDCYVRYDQIEAPRNARHEVRGMLAEGIHPDIIRQNLLPHCRLVEPFSLHLTYVVDIAALGEGPRFTLVGAFPPATDTVPALFSTIPPAPPESSRFPHLRMLTGPKYGRTEVWPVLNVAGRVVHRDVQVWRFLAEPDDTEQRVCMYLQTAVEPPPRRVER